MKIIVDKVPELKSDCLFVGFKKDRYVCCFYQNLIEPLNCLLRSDENGNPYPVVDYEVSGDEITVVDMIPGYTHNIINLSETEELVTFMWCNECFDPNKPDTYFEEV